jgi:hypothetical protein
MTITEKYGFQVSVDQFHNPVSSDFCDTGENELIELFEDTCLKLKNLNKNHYSMIELGSNHCYYSLLFKHIIGKELTTNIMVEPWEKNYLVGLNEFAINNCFGFFYKNSIGTQYERAGFTFDINEVKPILLEEILNKQFLSTIDVIHCDIDGSEHFMLDLNYNFFKTKKVKHLFLLTHTEELHISCKNILQSLDYELAVDNYHAVAGGDGLIIANS